MQKNVQKYGRAVLLGTMVYILLYCVKHNVYILI